jgi:hypothetical protein
MKMAEKGEFKITNPKAPFIKLTNILNETSVPKHKYGDTKWLLDNISHYISDEKQLKEATRLLDILTFKKKGK